MKATQQGRSALHFW